MDTLSQRPIVPVSLTRQEGTVRAVKMVAVSVTSHIITSVYDVAVLDNAVLNIGYLVTPLWLDSDLYMCSETHLNE